jgi:hypothetical protein
MPTEIIGEFGTPGANSEWLEAEGQLAIRHVKKICGDPPPEMKLEIVWQEHELGNYPTIGLVWDDPMRGTPWNYISRCEAALTAFENGGELPSGCTMPPVRSEDELNEPFEPDRPPAEPPGILDVFANQRYISKLIQWSQEASRRERSRSHLVERDDDPER